LREFVINLDPGKRQQLSIDQAEVGLNGFAHEGSGFGEYAFILHLF
jgi:hypothetical protein